MDSSTCNVIYVDRAIGGHMEGKSDHDQDHDTYLFTGRENMTGAGNGSELQCNLELLVHAFGQVHACASGPSCLAKLVQLHDASMVELKPTIVLIDTPHDEQILESAGPSREPSPHSKDSKGFKEFRDGSDSVTAAAAAAANSKFDAPDQDMYGLRLLEKIVCETHLRNWSKLVLAIPVISFPLLQTPIKTDVPFGIAPAEFSSFPSCSSSAATTTGNGHGHGHGHGHGYGDAPYSRYLSQAADPNSNLMTNRALLRKCLDSGAVDVMASPIHIKTLTTLEVHAHRAHKDAAREQQALMEVRRGRKRSWVGIHEEKPFSYLREAMVSGLMNGICKSGQEKDAGIGSVKVNVSLEQKAEIGKAIGKWHFCAHNFNDDQLLVAAKFMFKHAFSMPELEPWRISSDQLTTFLVSCRAAYNTFVPYHNFRHAVDVLQATFHFLVQLGVLPPYPNARPLDYCHSSPSPSPLPHPSPLAALLGPFEALTLLVSAIGHDVGHPGVNNGFLVVLNAPLAQLYNDRSVLESFHCAAFSQILRRYWPQAFEDTKMRSLMISSVLATDMGVHFEYMSRMNGLQCKLEKDGGSTDGWNQRAIDTEKALACALLIKCADISNVARRYDAAEQWMYILCDEFSRQAKMESEIGIASSLISEPKKDFLSLATAQLGFMELFAIPLFQGVAELLPSMRYTVNEMNNNLSLFRGAVQDLTAVDGEIETQGLGSLPQPGSRSPRSPRSPPALSLATTVVREGGDSSSGNTLDPSSFAAGKPGSSYSDQALPIRDEDHSGRMNGNAADYDSEVVADSADSDPFSMMDGENRTVGHNGNQRSSETTEGSSSLPFGPDWASRATSATTGKMPLSPSTQGTSIISHDSAERPYSGPTVSVPPLQPDTNHLQPPMAPIEPTTSSEEDHSNGSTLKPEKGLKKKTSRFKMNALNLFRRHKGTSSPTPGEPGG